MLVTPGATAYLLTDRFDHDLARYWQQCLVEFGWCVCELLTDSSTAGCIVLVQTGLFFGVSAARSMDSRPLLTMNVSSVAAG